MLSRYACMALIVFLVISAVSTAFAMDSYKPTANYRSRDDFNATGLAINIDRGAEIFDTVYHGITYTVIADQATVQLNNGKFGTIRDLKDKGRVRISGEQLSVKTILASTVVVMDDSGSLIDTPLEGYHPNDHIDTEGYVTRASPRDNEIDIHTRVGNYVVIVRPETVIRRYIYVTDVFDISERDDVKLTGTVDREGRIIAERIQVSVSNSSERKYSAGMGYKLLSATAVSGNREDVIEGTITYPTSAFDRSLGLNTRYGERKVDVPKGAGVLVNNQPASVHDLVKGDRLRVYGTWSGTTLIASRIESGDVAEPSSRAEEITTTPETLPDPEPSANQQAQAPVVETPRPGTLTGRIVNIDYVKSELSIDSDMKDIKVDAVNSAITRKGSTRRFSDLKKGDKIEVKGDWDGDILKAASLDVVE